MQYAHKYTSLGDWSASCAENDGGSSHGGETSWKGCKLHGGESLFRVYMSGVEFSIPSRDWSKIHDAEVFGYTAMDVVLPDAHAGQSFLPNLFSHASFDSCVNQY